MISRHLVLATFLSAGVLAAACSDQLPTLPSVPDSPTFAKGSGGGGGGGVPTSPSTPLSGPIYLRDSFGFDPLGDGSSIRYDAAGNPVPIFLSKSINQLRA